jgi:hypothetical protein
MPPPIYEHRELPPLRRHLIRLVLVTVVAAVLLVVWEIGVLGVGGWGLAVAIGIAFVPDVIRWGRQLSRAPLPPLHGSADDQR